MGKISATDSLKESIRLLETQKTEELQGLKEHFHITFESLRPVNLLRSSIDEMTSLYDLKSDIIDSVLGMLGGYLTQKLVERTTKNPFMRLLGLAMQYGVANLIMKNGENIRSFIVVWLEKILKPSKEETDTN